MDILTGVIAASFVIGTPAMRTDSQTWDWNEVTELHLVTWGDWTLRQENMGWPHRSVIGRIMEEGPGFGQGWAGPRAVPESPEASLIESILAYMRIRRGLGDLVEVIEEAYYYCIRDRRPTAEQQAKKLGISRASYQAKKGTAKTVIEMKLRDHYEKAA